MLFQNRLHAVTARNDLAELAHELTNTTACPSAGFRYNNLLLLNDSSSPDGAQEYAVFFIGDDPLRHGQNRITKKQIESITCSWMTAERCAETIALLDAHPEAGFDGNFYTLMLDVGHHRCRHCE
jgi:hypothetical protein